MVNCPMSIEVTVPQDYWAIKTKNTGMYWTPSEEDSPRQQDAERFLNRESARLELETWAPKGHSVVVRVRRKSHNL